MREQNLAWWFAVPTAVGTRVDTRFHTTCESDSFIPNLAKIRRRRPLRKEERQRIYSSAWTRVARPCIHIFAGSDTVLLHRPSCSPQAQHSVPRNPAGEVICTAPAGAYQQDFTVGCDDSARTVFFEKNIS